MLGKLNQWLEPTVGRFFLWAIAPIFAARIFIFPLSLPLVAYLIFTNNYTSTDVQLFFAFFILTTLGLSLGFHRQASHKSFQPHPAIRFLFLALGSMAFQAPVTYWVTTHLKHHAFSDRNQDPHSPVEKGFWHGHYGWTMSYDREQANDQYKRFIERDQMLMFFQHSYLLWLVLAAEICFLVGSWSGVLWGFVLATLVSDHLTRFINSWGHMHGSTPFKTNDNSRNNWWLALITYGDGWHNNHHAFPRSAFHGLRWYEIDISGYIIRSLEAIGLATKVVHISPEDIDKKLVKNTYSETIPENSEA